MHTAPTVPTVAPAGPDTQRESDTQRGSALKFTPTTALVASYVTRGDMTHTPDAPSTGNAVTTESISGRPQKAPSLTPIDVGTDLWNTAIQCHVVRMRDPAPHAPAGASGTLFGTVLTASLITFEYDLEPDDGPTGMGSGPKILIKPMQ